MRSFQSAKQTQAEADFDCFNDLRRSISAMPEMQPPPSLPKSQPFMRRNSTVIKLFGGGALILVMLIPLAMICVS